LYSSIKYIYINQKNHFNELNDINTNMANVDAFKSKILGLAVTNRYEIAFGETFLDGSPNNCFFKIPYYTMLAKDVTLPGLNLSITPITIWNLKRENVNGATYNPLSITFHCDHTLEIRKAFDQWLGICFDMKTRTAGFYDSYVCDMSISVLNRNNKPVYKAIISQIFPQDISDSNLNYENYDHLMDITVQFEYLRWEPISEINW